MNQTPEAERAWRTVMDDDNDLAAMGRFFRERSKLKRAANRCDSAKLLDEAGATYTVHNLGAHLIVDGPECVIDFWPGTGKWIVRNGGPTGRGVHELIKFVKEG